MGKEKNNYVSLAPLPEEDVIITNEGKVKLLSGKEIEWTYLEYPSLEKAEVQTQIQNNQYHSQIDIKTNQIHILDTYRKIITDLAIVIVKRGRLNLLLGAEKGLELTNIQYTDNLGFFIFSLESFEPESQKPYIFTENKEEDQDTYTHNDSNILQFIYHVTD